MSRYCLAITKEYTWDCAHMLANHEGLCKNIHGHTYKMEVTVARINNDEDKYNAVITDSGHPAEGMVTDFKHLKEIVKGEIVDKLDHAMIINMYSADPCEQEVYKLLEKYGKKIYPVCYRPTAENMAMSFARKIDYMLREKNLGLTVLKVRLYETPTSYADYILNE